MFGFSIFGSYFTPLHYLLLFYLCFCVCVCLVSCLFLCLFSVTVMVSDSVFSKLSLFATNIPEVLTKYPNSLTPLLFSHTQEEHPFTLKLHLRANPSSREIVIWKGLWRKTTIVWRVTIVLHLESQIYDRKNQIIEGVVMRLFNICLIQIDVQSITKTNGAHLPLVLLNLSCYLANDPI